MPVTIELTYEMGKALGEMRLQIEAPDVPAAVDATRARFVGTDTDFDSLRIRTAVAVNGVLVRHRDEAGTRLRDGDRLSFVKAAAGG